MGPRGHTLSALSALRGPSKGFGATLVRFLWLRILNTIYATTAPWPQAIFSETENFLFCEGKLDFCITFSDPLFSKFLGPLLFRWPQNCVALRSIGVFSAHEVVSCHFRKEHQLRRLFVIVAGDSMGDFVGSRLAEQLAADVMHIPVASGELWLHLFASAEPMCET